MLSIIPPKSQASRAFRLSCALVAMTLFALVEVGRLTAQASATKQAAPHARHAQRRHSRAKAVQSQAKPAPPAAPELPPWPINKEPNPASVTWDSHGLQIKAANSSLQQILHEVTTDTGIRVEGLGADQRIFGTYGPGKPREVLSQLLHGTGYNVIMVGGEDSGAPLRILLSGRPAGPTPTQPGQASPRNDDSGNDGTYYEPPVPPRLIQNGFNPGGPIRAPQQMPERMRQEQQIDQMNTPRPPQ
jgi:hypothetical protein